MQFYLVLYLLTKVKVSEELLVINRLFLLIVCSFKESFIHSLSIFCFHSHSNT